MGERLQAEFRTIELREGHGISVYYSYTTSTGSPSTSFWGSAFDRTDICE